jgi:hypothetical protein
MTLRIWKVGSNGEIIRPTSFGVLPGLPKGLPDRDAPDYLLSNRYANVLGANLPRRQVLLGLASSIAATATAFRRANAVPILVPVGIAVVTLLASVYKVFEATRGSFKAENQDDDRVKGYLVLKVTDDKTDTIEESITTFYTFPANTTVTIEFNRGPSATTKGDKKLVVAAQDSSDEDSFEAT